MKSSRFVFSLGSLLIAGFAATFDEAAAWPDFSAIPSVPVGALSTFPTIAQAGTRPALTWAIVYPSQVSDLVMVRSPGTMIPNQSVYATVQMVGSTVTHCDATLRETPLATEARVSLNGSNYIQLFYGTQSEVNPAPPLYIKKLDANQSMDFGGRFVRAGAWSPFFTTRSANLQVVALTKGQTPPTTFNLAQSPKLAAYLKPYLDGSGRVNIGPMSVLVMMELGQSDRNSPCFDYQDQVMLVTFSLQHPNNGHGNNLDGVDASNPGGGQGGPNGNVDPSNGVDDENH